MSGDDASFILQLLLRQSVQSNTGLLKDVRIGRTTLADDENHQLQVAHQTQTGAFASRMDHLSVNELISGKHPWSCNTFKVLVIVGHVHMANMRSQRLETSLAEPCEFAEEWCPTELL